MALNGANVVAMLMGVDFLKYAGGNLKRRSFFYVTGMTRHGIGDVDIGLPDTVLADSLRRCPPNAFAYECLYV